MVRALDKDFTPLFDFRLAETMNNDELSISIDSLMNDGLVTYLHKVKIEIGAANDKVAGSMLIKRYAFLAVIALYTMSKYDRKLNVNPNNLTLVSSYADGLWLPKFYFVDQNFEAIVGNREHFREQYVRDIFANHIFLLIDLVSKTTNISKLVLWENIAVYLFWLYENVLSADKEQNEWIEKDFRYIFYEAPGNVFGTYHNNPLTKYDSEKIYNLATEKFIRARKTCCFSYQLESGKRCSTCPCLQLDEEGRCQSEPSFCSTIRSVND